MCIFFILVLELFLKKKINNAQKKNQWIITKNKNYIKFNKSIIDKIFQNSFNKILGWDRYPNQKIRASKNNKMLFYKFSNEGFRNLNLSYKKKFAVFGDSFAFGSFVNDKSCWSYVISKKLKKNFINYAVPNYGFDQALIKYENKKLDKNVENIIIGIVPETISRIQNIWKNYLEFGNIYGFKPRYIVKNKKLRLLSNPIKSKNDFKDVFKIIENCKKNDFFYKNKYLKYQFCNFYLLDFFKNFRFNIYLLYLLIKKNNTKFNKLIFTLVYKTNIECANNLYKNFNSIDLFDKLISKFVKIAKKRNHKPIIVIFPQKYDIKIFKDNKNKYKDFFNKQKKKLLIIDLTEDFSKTNYRSFFQDDKYGGHLNEKGNLFVSNKISEKLN